MAASDRASSWSITWYPPTDSLNREVSEGEIKEFAKRQLPPGWKMEGQMEQCPTTLRYHYQGYLKTNQQRFSAVKKHMDTAHIEPARTPQALQRYAHKDETRIAEIPTGTSVPTIFEYQVTVAKCWKDAEFQNWMANFPNKPQDEVAMLYLDSIVSRHISEGMRGPEWIATNPMWRNAWKKFWRSIIERENGTPRTQGSEGQEAQCDGTQTPCSEEHDSGRVGVYEGDAPV